MIFSIEWDIAEHEVEGAGTFFRETKPTLTIIVQPGEDWTPRIAEVRQKLRAIIDVLKDDNSAEKLHIVKIEKDRRRRTD